MLKTKKFWMIVLCAHVAVIFTDVVFDFKWPDVQKEELYRFEQKQAEKRIRAENEAEITRGGVPQK